jgi:hypothetical protein
MNFHIEEELNIIISKEIITCPLIYIANPPQFNNSLVTPQNTN